MDRGRKERDLPREAKALWCWENKRNPAKASIAAERIVEPVGEGHAQRKIVHCFNWRVLGDHKGLKLNVECV